MNFFFLAYMICAGFLLLHEKVKKLYDPVAYALICTLAWLGSDADGLDERYQNLNLSFGN